MQTNFRWDKEDLWKEVLLLENLFIIGLLQSLSTLCNSILICHHLLSMLYESKLEFKEGYKYIRRYYRYEIISVWIQSRCHPLRSSSSESYAALFRIVCSFDLCASITNLLISFSSWATSAASLHSFGRVQILIDFPLDADRSS